MCGICGQYHFGTGRPVLRQEIELVGSGSAQCHMGQIGALAKDGLEPLKHSGGKVQTEVAVAVWRQSDQQQPGATADLEHSVRPQGAQPGHGMLDPQAHLRRRDRLASIAAVPAD